MLINDNVLPAERIGNRHRLPLDAVLSCREERRTRQYDALAATADIDRDDDPETSESNYAKHEALWRRAETKSPGQADTVSGTLRSWRSGSQASWRRCVPTMCACVGY